MAMLQRVAFDNYKIYNKRQTVDFRKGTEDADQLFTLVGENGCGKSTLLKLIGYASNFGCPGPIRDLRVCDSSRESIVACEYCLENWSGLLRHDRSSFSSTHPEFKLWFVDGILKISENLQEFMRERIDGGTSEATTNPLTLVTGFKHSPPSTSSDETISCFLFVKSGDKITALIQPFDQKARVGFAKCATSEDMLNWIPDHVKFEDTELSFIRGDDTDSKIQKLEDSHPITIMNLRNTIYPEASRDDIWKEAIELFHQLTGDQKITVEYIPESDSVKIIEKLNGVAYEKYDLPEGFFYALVVAVLLVSPLTKTVLLDEPTRGMHPLQVRRLRRILSQKSKERNKVIIVTSHTPDLLHGSPIDHTFRFRRFASGFSEIRRVTSEQSAREARFIGAAETRELFFTRRIIWVEGDTDRRFCDAMLKLIDEGNKFLWNALLSPVEQQVTGSGPIQNLFGSSFYEKKVFLKKDLEAYREPARTCSVLPLSGKRNIGKAVKICKDLRIPYCGIIDLDALLPCSKDQLKDHFNNSGGDWTKVPVNGGHPLRTDRSPAYLCVKNNTQLESQLQSCVNAQQVVEFYESKERIFGWLVEGGEIEDLVRVTRSTFKKDDWKDFAFDEFQELIEEMLKQENGPNPEILRCFYFILDFLQRND